MSLQPISKALANPAAKRVYDQIMAMPDDESAQMYTTMVVAGALANDMDVHHQLLQKRLDEIIAKRVDKVKTALSRSAISKSRSGEDIDAVVAASVVIAKDFDFSDEERRKFAERQPRDPSGRFRTMRQRIMYTDRHRPLPRKHAAKVGIPAVSDLHGQDLARYQQAYSQVSSALAPFTSLSSDEAFLHLTYATPAGRRVTETVDLPSQVNNGRFEDIGLESAKFKDGGRLVEVGVAVNPNLSAQGAAFDLVGALGGSADTAGLVGRGLERNPDNRFKGAESLKAFGNEWDQHMADDVYNPANRVYRRFSTGSRLLRSLAGVNPSPRMRLAIEASDFVGQYGQEAQRVIGPHADRAAYRYRGVERTPDPVLQQIVNRARAQASDPNAARNALIYGEPGPEEIRGNRVVRGEPRQSPLITYFGGVVDQTGNTKGGRLPNADLGSLQVKSGVVPPSEGIIIDRNGKIVTQAVGYGDDWYLPFNLKTLSKLKGGEYIRTRTWGGPTTEDVYTALVSGARSLTVISHNGVYTIEFDNSFRGGRRFNDKAARMVKRYGHILDAVKSKEVTLSGIPEDRNEELKAKAALRYDPKEEKLKYEAELKELRQAEKENPQMSAAARQSLAEDFLEERASDMLTDQPGHKDWTTLAENYVNTQVATREAQHRFLIEQGQAVPPLSLAETRVQAAREVTTPEDTIHALGEDRAWAQYLKHAELEYKAKQSPLNLDGAGYDKAMNALREQFPYYIASTSWQPRRRGGYDTGYVKPKYNRPADALSGYYDPTISGLGQERNQQGKLTGKVSADRTRFQNAGVSEAVRNDARFSERKNAAGEVLNPRRAEGEATEAAETRAGARSTDATAQAAQRLQAVRALRDSVRNRESVIYDGAPVAIEQARPSLIQYMGLIFGSNDAFESAYRRDPTATVRSLRQQVDSFRDRGFGEVDQDAYDQAFDPEHAERGATWTDNSVMEAVQNKNKLYDFGPDYAPNRDPQLYAELGRELARRIPDADFDEANLGETLDRYIDAEYEKFLGHGVPGHRYAAANLSDARNNIKRAMQVKALRRRYQEESRRRAALEASQRQRAELQRGGVDTAFFGDPSWLADQERRMGLSHPQLPPPRPNRPEDQG